MGGDNVCLIVFIIAGLSVSFIALVLSGLGIFVRNFIRSVRTALKKETEKTSSAGETGEMRTWIP